MLGQLLQDTDIEAPYSYPNSGKLTVVHLDSRVPLMILLSLVTHHLLDHAY